MKRLATFFVSLLLALTGSLHAQPLTTMRAVWFQPARNVPMLVALGFDTFLGPEVENGKNLSAVDLAKGQAAWIQSIIDNDAKCVLKNPTGTLPPNCVGVMIEDDEANGKGIPPAALVHKRDDLRARYPGVPIWLSLAGDKITSANFLRKDADGKFPELQLYKDYGDVADILTVDVYSKNRSTKYPTTWTGDAVAKLVLATGKPVLGWQEMNDQVLPPPTGSGETNRAPTEQEIQDTWDYCASKHPYGFGIFATCDRGKYGWGTSTPLTGDSYWPLVDRNKASMALQINRVKRINLLIGPPPLPTPAPQDPTLIRLKILEQNQDTIQLQLQAIDRRLINMGQAAISSTQPSK